MTEEEKEEPESIDDVVGIERDEFFEMLHSSLSNLELQRREILTNFNDTANVYNEATRLSEKYQMAYYYNNETGTLFYRRGPRKEMGFK